MKAHEPPEESEAGRKTGMFAAMEGLCMALLSSAPCDPAALDDALGDAQAQLEDLIGEYGEPSCEGTETVRRRMVEALGLYRQSVAQMQAFLRDGDGERLTGSLEAARAGEDIVAALGTVVGESLKILASLPHLPGER